MARSYEGVSVKFRLPPEHRQRVWEIAEARAEAGRRVSESTPSAVLRALIDRALQDMDELAEQELIKS